MGAREKLNAGYFNGSMLLAAVVGGLTQSWLVFTLALAGLLALNLYTRQIRPNRPGR